MNVADAIATHRGLVERYYDLFNDDGDLLADPTEADAGLRKTVDAFNVIAAAPCSTIEEVRAKVTYILRGGERRALHAPQRPLPRQRTALRREWPLQALPPVDPRRREDRMKRPLTVSEYVVKIEALGFRFRACRRANRRELSITFPVIVPSASDDLAGQFGAGRDIEVFEFIAKRDGVLTLPPISEVSRPTFGARPRPPYDNGGSAA